MRQIGRTQTLPRALQRIDRRPRVVLPNQEFTDGPEQARMLRETELIWLSGAGLRVWD